MNKTININLAGIVFHIDEEAYHKLQNYLEAIKRSLKGTLGKEEIIADIESRIAELFTQKTSDKKQVIITADVDEIINIMGQPEDYQVDETIFEEETASQSKAKPRKLYRDTDNNIVGGVCSGISHYLGLDPVWVRLFFVLLFFIGVSVLVYVILWIVIPEAKTTAQKLEMQGEDANITNIEKKVKESFENVKKKVGDIDLETVEGTVRQKGKSFFHLLGSIINSFFLFLGKFFEGLFKVIGKLIGVVLLIISIVVIFSIFISFIGFSLIDINLGNDFFLFNFNEQFIDTPLWMSSILLFLAIGIPFFFLLYLSLKLLINGIKGLGNSVKLSLLGIWLLVIISLIFIGVNQATSYSLKTTTTESNAYPIAASDTLHIKMFESKHYKNIETPSEFNGMTMSYDEAGNKVIYSELVRFTLFTSETDQFEVEEAKSAKGKNYENARERAQEISHQIQWDSSTHTLKISNYFTVPRQSKMRDQRVDVNLYVPKNLIVKLDKNTAEHIDYDNVNDQNLYRSEMAGHLWKMNEDHLLNCQDCD